MFLCREKVLQINMYPIYIYIFLGFLAFLMDAYQDKERSDSSDNVNLCTVLHLHPQLAPVKVAVLSQLPQQNELCEVAQQLSSELREAGRCRCSSHVCLSNTKQVCAFGKVRVGKEMGYGFVL